MRSDWIVGTPLLLIDLAFLAKMEVPEVNQIQQQVCCGAALRRFDPAAFLSALTVPRHHLLSSLFSAFCAGLLPRRH
jgi:hypothetical protein